MQLAWASLSAPQARPPMTRCSQADRPSRTSSRGVSVAFDDDSAEPADDLHLGVDPWSWDDDIDGPDNDAFPDPFTSRPRSLPVFDATLPEGPHERPRWFERATRTTAVVFLVLTVAIGAAPATRAGPLGSSSLVACGILGWVFLAW